MESEKSNVKKSGRRSIKNSNLEQVVEFICSQDESDEDYNTNGDRNEILCETPSRNKRAGNVATPSASHNVLQEMSQTPRRSCRKSIKPSQDYEDIVGKSLSISTRSAKKQLLTGKGEQNENADVLEPKWTPAKVGRVSQKRRRKSKRTLRGINENDAEAMQWDEKIVSDDADTDELIEKAETIEQYVENSNGKIDNINHAKHSNNQHDSNVKSNEILEPTAHEVTNDVNEKILIKEAIDNEDNINETMEYNDCQVNKEKEAQPEADDETDGDSKDTNDTEDCQKIEKFENEEICIIYESNISNTDLKEEREDKIQTVSNKNNAMEEELDGSFGCYLKSQEINISDLGLNPLKDEEEEKELSVYQTKQSTEETEEMPSLVVCDDDENDETVKKLNETYEANDSVIVVEAVPESIPKHDEEIMESLQLSDEGGETPKKGAYVDLTDMDLKDNSALVTPKRTAKHVQLPLSISNFRATPKQKTKPYRFPTPYRTKKNYDFNEKENEANVSNKHAINASIISVTTLEPKEIVLRGIRKRSLSLCVDGNDEKRQKFLAGPTAKVKHDRMVSFYSPANQTAFTDDLDVIIKNSVKKQNPQEKALVNKFVTTRRKRSLSLDESILISKLPRPVVGQHITRTKTSPSTSKPLSRTKLPNFAAIHQKQFKKMENLVEHVNRKQERSKNLINSTTKLKTASSQKDASTMKNDNTTTLKSKVTKKLDLQLPTKNKVLNTTIAQAKASETETVKHMPHTTRVAVVKPMKSGSIPQNTTQHQQQINNHLKPSQITNIEKPRLNVKTVAPTKPFFNLSTSLMVKPTTSNFIEKANASQMSSNDKMASRLQHHMDLFKGRAASSRAGTASRRNEVILKGVRSNRRFELQMQHRRNLEQ